MKALRWIALLFGVATTLGLAGFGVWRLRARAPRVRAEGAGPVKVPRVVRADGRVVTSEGGRVTIGAETTGTVERVLVREGSVVRAGDPLVLFRAGEQAAAVQEAYAQTREADASLRFLDGEVKRTRALVTSGSVAKQALDKIVQERDAARARKSAAAAAAQRFHTAVARTRIVAPISGTVIARTVEPGETVPTGAPLLVVADLSRLRVDAEVDEFDALRVTAGMSATVTVDGADVPPIAGKVDEMALFVGPRALRPQDPARPTDAQVLRVTIGLEEGPRLKLGQRVTVALTDAPPGS